MSLRRQVRKQFWRLSGPNRKSTDLLVDNEALRQQYLAQATSKKEAIASSLTTPGGRSDQNATIAANVQKPQRTSLFLSALPYEIRMLVYSYLLSDHRIIVASHKSLWRPFIEPHLRTRLWPAILRTNHQIHEEGASVLYGNTFFMSTLLYATNGPQYSDIFGTSGRYCKYVQKIVTYCGHWAITESPSMRQVVQMNGFDFRNITMLAIAFRGTEDEYQDALQRQCTLLDPIEWPRLRRFVRLDGHAEWLEKEPWLVFWGRR